MMICDLLCFVLVIVVLFSIICIPSTVGCCFYCWYKRYRRRRILEHYRRLLFEPVSVPVLDDESQRLLDESYESYPATYGRGVSPSRLTPQDCINHCKKIVFTNTIAGNSYSCINESCSVCLEDFNHRETIVLCPCHHGFHEKCLLNWFRKSPFPHYKCPICKSPVVQL